MSSIRKLHYLGALVGFGILFCIQFVDAERPGRSKTTPDRSLRSANDTQPEPVPVDASPVRMRVETREGVLVVFDAGFDDIRPWWILSHFWTSSPGPNVRSRDFMMIAIWW